MLIKKLITKNEVDVRTPKGVLNGKIIAEALLPNFSPNFKVITFITNYYIEEEVTYYDESTDETITSKSKIGLHNYSVEKDISEVNMLFAAQGVDVTKANMTFEDGLWLNFEKMFHFVITNGDYYGIAPTDWEIKS